MAWAVAAGAAVSAVGGFLSASGAKKQAAAQASAAATERAWQAVDGYNQATGKYKQLSQDYAALNQQNTMNLVRQGYRAGLMNVQRGLAKKQAVQQGFDVSVMAKKALGGTNANAAAAGASGASADAVINDIKMREGQAQIDNQENYGQYLQNFNNEVEGMRLANEAEIATPRELIITGDLAQKQDFTRGLSVSGINPWVNAAAAGITSAAGNYISQKASLGLNNQQATTTTYPSGGGFSGGALGSGTFGMGGNLGQTSPINGGWKIY